MGASGYLALLKGTSQGFTRLGWPVGENWGKLAKNCMKITKPIFYRKATSGLLSFASSNTNKKYIFVLSILLYIDNFDNDEKGITDSRNKRRKTGLPCKCYISQF